MCKAHLTDGGIVAANVWYAQADYYDMLKTYKEVFAEFHVMRCANSTNAIIVAFPEKRGLTGESWMEACNTFEKKYPTNLGLAKLVDHALEDATRIPTDAKVLLDRNVPK